jgi:fructose-1,6-bisphosphatase-3
MRDLNYLTLLSSQYPSIGMVCSEIVNLQAILNLPKPTEHFLTDIHGEYEAFTHILRTASGVLKLKIEDVFGYRISSEEKKNLARLIFYPEQNLERIKGEVDNMADWYRVNIYRLISICKVVSSKYTRSKVRKALPKDFAYIIEELLHLKSTQLNKEEYYNQIINTIIEIERADKFIISISKLIQRLAVDKLHIIGDIYDRGPGAHIIMDELLKHHNCDIQWGNHDILWMGAALGQKALVATALRVSLRYGNLETLDEGYGISLFPLARFAMEVYKDDPCSEFAPRLTKKQIYEEQDKYLLAQMHKAISVIQFKLESRLIRKRAEFDMNDQSYLDHIDYEKGTINIDGKDYKLSSNNFPTIDPKKPYELTKEEKELINKMTFYFKNSEKLQKHAYFLYTNGTVYQKYNGNLLYHGCVPVDEKGDFLNLKIIGKTYKGKELLDKFDELVRKAFFNPEQGEDYRDWLWYLWRGKISPVFGKNRMTTFENYFLEEPSTHEEPKNPYFNLRENEDFCIKILNTFGLNPFEGHIINGHTPVKVKKGESPIKANGRLLVIDGGFSTAYQPQTGIAGYTLIYNSYGLRLASHSHFEGLETAISEGQDIVSSINVLEKTNRKKVSDTDTGRKILEKISDLKDLLRAYKEGLLKEKVSGKLYSSLDMY